MGLANPSAAWAAALLIAQPSATCRRNTVIASRSVTHLRIASS
jgi:hypothetical protein